MIVDGIYFILKMASKFESAGIEEPGQADTTVLRLDRQEAPPTLHSYSHWTRAWR